MDKSLEIEKRFLDYYSNLKDSPYIIDEPYRELGYFGKKPLDSIFYYWDRYSKFIYNDILNKTQKNIVTSQLVDTRLYTTQLDYSEEDRGFVNLPVKRVLSAINFDRVGGRYQIKEETDLIIAFLLQVIKDIFKIESDKLKLNIKYSTIIRRSEYKEDVTQYNILYQTDSRPTIMLGCINIITPKIVGAKTTVCSTIFLDSLLMLIEGKLEIYQIESLNYINVICKQYSNRSELKAKIHLLISRLNSKSFKFYYKPIIDKEIYEFLVYLCSITNNNFEDIEEILDSIRLYIEDEDLKMEITKSVINLYEKYL